MFCPVLLMVLHQWVLERVLCKAADAGSTRKRGSTERIALPAVAPAGRAVETRARTLPRRRSRSEGRGKSTPLDQALHYHAADLPATRTHPPGVSRSLQHGKQTQPHTFLLIGPPPMPSTTMRFSLGRFEFVAGTTHPIPIGKIARSLTKCFPSSVPSVVPTPTGFVVRRETPYTEDCPAGLMLSECALQAEAPPAKTPTPPLASNH